MSGAPARSKLLLRLGCGVCALLSAAALAAPCYLYGDDVRRAAATEEALLARLRLGPDRAGEAPDVAAPIDAIDAALGQRGLGLEPGMRAFHEAEELQLFEAARVRGPFETDSEARSLVPPSSLHAAYSLGGITLTWLPGAVNVVRAAALATRNTDLRLAFRIYRALEGSDLVLLDTLPFETTTWRDEQLPIAASRISYQVWVVLLRRGADGEVLVGADRSDLVTVTAPEHFTLSLVRGTTTEAVFLVQVDLPGAVSDTLLTARVGDELKAGVWTTGLTLRMLETTREAVLASQTRLLLTTDGSLVLDPETNEPRTTQTQILQPVTRLSATLTAADGATRTLQVDLP